MTEDKRQDHTVFGLPGWVASVLIVAFFGYWLLMSVKSGRSLSLGLMPEFSRDAQPAGYWTAVGLGSFFFAVGLISLLVPNWISLLPGQH
ncbi:MAG: hypothetical protein ACXU82_14425 [Caulobacteraceae bacterium]